MEYHLESQMRAFPNDSWKLVKTFDTRREAESAMAGKSTFATRYRILETLGDMVTPAIDQRTPAMKASHKEQAAQAICRKLDRGTITEDQAQIEIARLNLE